MTDPDSWSFSAASSNNYKFTGKERDTESGLDFFGARHYASASSRFMQPDDFPGGPVDAFSSNDPAPPGPLPYAPITNPQALNKFAYTYNNPLRYTDPDGHSALDVVLGAANAWVSDNLGGAGRNEAYNSDYAKGQAVGDAGAAVTGAIEARTGDATIVGGVGASTTGVGALAGVPAVAIGAAAEVHGSATV